MNFTQEEHYDAFISYRRKHGAEIARLIKAHLLQRNLRAFLDVDDLPAGHFDEAILRQVQTIPNFILILSPDCLSGCSDRKDWLRIEICCALDNEKNVIPIRMPGFQFPKPSELPHDIRDIHLHQCLGYSHEFFDAMMEKITNFLVKAQNKPQNLCESKSKPQRGIITGNRVLVRAGPTVAARYIAEINKGDEVDILEIRTLNDTKECQLKDEYDFKPIEGNSFRLHAGKGLLISGERSNDYRIEIIRKKKRYIGYVPKNAVILLDPATWFRIRKNDLSGWVLSRYIREF